ncbi:MAG: ATP-binding protein, partial [Sneathiellales bacterium]|nr:ATP-binding protein [Sneathiellales bacterium]
MPTLERFWQDNAASGLFRSIFEASSDLMAITTDGKRTHLAVNKSWLDTLHLTEEEVLGRSGVEIGLWPQGQFPDGLARLIAAYEPFDDFPVTLQSRNGEIIHCILKGQPLNFGKDQGWLFTSRDITFAKQADQAVSNSQAILIDALESIHEGFVLYGKDGGLIICNSKFRDFYGYSEEEASFGAHRKYLGQLDIERKTVLVDNEGIGYYVNRREDLDTGPPASFEVRLRDGRILMLSDRLTSSGGVVSIQSDITEQRRLENIISRTKKMDAIGQLTGGIAHDFNNILNVILGNLELLEEMLDEGSDLHTLAGSALKGVTRGTNITQKLLGFARKEASNPQTVNPNHLIANLEELLKRSLTASVELRLDLQKEVWNIDVDPGDLENVLINLSLNARDAMPEGGILTISTQNIDESTPLPETVSRKEGSRYVCIAIADTGTGMEGDVLEKAFEPFYTTKKESGGTGLGLSTVYGFAKRSGGQLYLHSDPGKGTNVFLYLERSPDPAFISSPTFQDPLQEGGGETILIVDDEEALLELAATFLRKRGYSILTAKDGIEALVVLNENPDIDILFSDVIMPNGLDGFQLALKARNVIPDIKVLLASGYTGFDKGTSKAAQHVL